MKMVRRIAALAMVAALSVGATKQPATNWLAQVNVTPNGAHIVGNPKARVRLVEYVSYTCSHCAAFEQQASGELGLGFIRPGTGSVEYRPFMRNIVDITATLLVNCGPASRFPLNHSSVLRSQQKWMADVSETQQRRWLTIGDFPGRMRAIAGDMHLYELFAARGYSRVELDRCLADEGLAKRISEENQTASRIGAVDSTPSFLINDRQQDVHDWAGLRPLLMALTR
jgi:protein-disulfide isomerase